MREKIIAINKFNDVKGVNLSIFSILLENNWGYDIKLDEILNAFKKHSKGREKKLFKRHQEKGGILPSDYEMTLRIAKEIGIEIEDIDFLFLDDDDFKSIHNLDKMFEKFENMRDNLDKEKFIDLFFQILNKFHIKTELLKYSDFYLEEVDIVYEYIIELIKKMKIYYNLNRKIILNEVIKNMI